MLSVEYGPITLSAGKLHHLKSKALSGHMVVLPQQYAEKYLLFLQFFPLSDVYSSLKHHTPYAESFHPHIKEPLILPSVFALVKGYSSLSTLRKILWLCTERVLMVCGGAFGVWSRLMVLAIKFT